VHPEQTALGFYGEVAQDRPGACAAPAIMANAVRPADSQDFVMSRPMDTILAEEPDASHPATSDNEVPMSTSSADAIANKILRETLSDLREVLDNTDRRIACLAEEICDAKNQRMEVHTRINGVTAQQKNLGSSRIAASSA
jgi:hypothetical protein